MTGGGRKLRWALLAAAAVILVAVATLRQTEEPPSGHGERKSLAVLPFENLSADPDDVYISDGMHNDLLTQLTKIGGLKVISRTSVREYRYERKNLREIGRELGVSVILEGGVQRVGDQIRINVQLIDTSTDEHLWANTYDRKLTVENVLTVQREITTSIAGALHAALSPETIARIESIPTKNTLAYDFYWAGNQYMADPDRRKSVPLAVHQYQRAVDEDPQFALAWAALARSQTAMYLDRFLDRRQARLAMAEDALHRAFALSPELPEAYLASGNFHEVVGSYDKALADYDRAEQDLPGDARIFWRRAALLERAGRWDESIAEWKRAVELDPRNVGILQGQATTYYFLREYGASERIYDRVLELRPDLSEAYFYRNAIIPFLRDGDYAAVLATLQNPQSASVNTDTRHFFGWIAPMYKRDFAGAVKFLEGWPADENGKVWRYLDKRSFLGSTYRASGQTDIAAGYFREVATLTEAALEKIRSEPPKAIPEEHAIQLGQLAEALTASGRTDEASRLMHQAIDMMVAAGDAVWVSIMREEAISKVFGPLGDVEAAIEQLDAYLSVPGRKSIECLVLDPRLDPIRDDPRFQALVKKYRRK